ncbi:MAG: SDR family oxidoreductase [Proteobacteria bacterium]|nr:SDR family oxidoreductase [Pseudomonadota bacterium]
MRLAQKAALITGAAAGIGAGVARRFAREGAKLWLCDIDAAACAQLGQELRGAHGIELHTSACDVSDREQVIAIVQQAIAHFGGVDILVNNAWGRRPGQRGYSPLQALQDADVDWGMEIAPKAALWAMQTAYPGMRERGWGRIINMCSLNGVNAHPYTADYNMAKEALRTLTRTAAREWAADGICCNAICPGAATEAYQKFAAANPANAAELLKLNPMGRMGDPEHDIGSVALFLASDDCRYLTGNTLFVDGGSHINGIPWLPQARDS